MSSKTKKERMQCGQCAHVIIRVNARLELRLRLVHCKTCLSPPVKYFY